MKRLICLIFLISQCFFLFTQETAIEKYFSDKFIPINLIDSMNHYIGSVMFENGTITCGRGGEIETIIFSNAIFSNDDVTVYFDWTGYKNHKEGDSLKYRRWIFPIKYKVTISLSDLKKEFNSTSNYVKTDILVDTTETYPTTCQAIIIDDLNVRDSPSLSGKKLGLLKKGTEVTLYEQSSNSNEKDYWYKVKLDDEKYGWVFGEYVRIFFEDENLGYSDKERILESIK